MSGRLAFHRPRPVPLLMSAAAVLLLFGLGIWQLQRLAWKEGLVAELTVAQRQVLESLPQDVGAAQRFYHARISGEYLPGTSYHLAARYFRSKLGYSLLHPFRLDDGRVVLVNRGWIPAAMKDSEQLPPPPNGPQSLRVQIRTSNERNYFTPENQPQHNVWFGRDVDAIAAHSGLSLLPVTLDVIGQQDQNTLPVPATGEIVLRNDHLGYAITWFGIGLAVLTISLLYHRKKPEDSGA